MSYPNECCRFFLSGVLPVVQSILLSLWMWTGMIVVVQLLSRVWLFVTPWTATGQASLSFTISWSLLKFVSIESVMLSNHQILCQALLLFAFNLFPESGCFPVSWVFALGGQSNGASASVLLMSMQGWFLLDWLVWSPCSAADFQELSPPLPY